MWEWSYMLIASWWGIDDFFCFFVRKKLKFQKFKFKFQNSFKNLENSPTLHQFLLHFPYFFIAYSLLLHLNVFFLAFFYNSRVVVDFSCAIFDLLQCECRNFIHILTSTIWDHYKIALKIVWYKKLLEFDEKSFFV